MPSQSVDHRGNGAVEAVVFGLIKPPGEADTCPSPPVANGSTHIPYAFSSNSPYGAADGRTTRETPSSCPDGIVRRAFASLPKGSGDGYAFRFGTESDARRKAGFQ